MTDSIRMAVVGLFFTAVVFGIHFYIWHRLIVDASLSPPLRHLLTGALVVMGLSIVAAIVLGHSLSPDKSRLITFGPLVWQGAMMLFFFLLLAVDLGQLLYVLIVKVTATDNVLADPTRRRMMGRVVAGGAVLLVTGMTGTAVAMAARRPRVIATHISLARFPASLNGLKVVQISDLHVGLTITGEWVRDVVQRVNALQPDVIVITGDLVDGSVPLLAPHVAPLKDLVAPRGVFFVMGNHDYYSGASQWIACVESLGIRVLQNERVEIGDGDDLFYLAGVNDYTAHSVDPSAAADLDRALAGCDPAREIVLLAHQPREIDNAQRLGVGLVLSGHTHGGQIWPFRYLVGLQQPYNKGLYRHSATTQIYVNQGTGLWGPPMRLGTESEITEIFLKRA